MEPKKKYFSINLDFFKAYHKIIMKILLIELNWILLSYNIVL